MNQTYADWLKQNPPPDLEALAAEYGGLGLVPDEAWRQFQQQRRQWEDRRISRLLRR